MTNKLFRTTTLLAVFLCAVFFVGCRKIEKKVDTQETVRDDVVIFGIEPETLDQHGSTSVATAIVMRNIYGNLYRRSPDGQIVSKLANSYTVNDDFTSYTFTLKDNLKFSDGPLCLLKMLHIPIIAVSNRKLLITENWKKL